MYTTMGGTPLNSLQKIALGLPEWVDATDTGDGRVFMWNVTPDQARQFGANEIKGVYSGSGKAKRAVIVTSAEWLRKYSDPAQDKDENFAAYGAAMNIGKPAFTEMEIAGWTPVTPDPVIVAERFGDLAPVFAPDPEPQPMTFGGILDALKGASAITGPQTMLEEPASAGGFCPLITPDPTPTLTPPLEPAGGNGLLIAGLVAAGLILIGGRS